MHFKGESNGLSLRMRSRFFPHLVLYLQHLATQTRSRAAVEEAVNASSWVLQLAGMEPLGQDPLVKMVLLSSLQRDLAKPTRKKEPITLDVLQQVVDSVGQTPTLSEIRLLTIMLLAFAAFLRFDEIAKLRCCDVQFHDAHMSIKIIASQADQYREGNEVVVSRARSKLCPVSMVERYFSMAQIEAKVRSVCFKLLFTVDKFWLLKLYSG
jgi:integrase